MLNPIFRKCPEFGDKDPAYTDPLPEPLTDWEILAGHILYVSLDELNSLNLDTTFLLASNRELDDDNEDDRQEKEEFLVSCEKRIKKALSIMKLCVSYNLVNITGGQGELDILDDSVYVRVRFARIANDLRKKLQTKADKDKMVKQFK